MVRRILSPGVVICLLGLSPLLAVPALLASESIRLSPEFGPGTGVGSFRATSDSQWIHYVANLAVGECSSLFRVHRTGGPSVRLSGPPSAGCVVSLRGYSGDPERVVFIRESAGQPPTLVSVPVDGVESQATELKVGYSAGGNFGSVLPSGAEVFFYLNPSSSERELHVVPVAGPMTAARRIDTGGTQGFQPVPEHNRVLYIDGLGLFSLSLSPGAIAVRLDQALPASDGVMSFRVSPDGSLVLFVAEQVQAGRDDLFVVPIAGPASAALPLSAALGPGETIGKGFGHWRFTPGGSRVIFETFVGSSQGGIYSVPSQGPPSSMVQLNDPAPSSSLSQVAVTPDGETVLFTGSQQSARRDVYSVPVEGPATAALRLNHGSEAVVSYSVSEDGSKVVYLTDGGAWVGGNGLHELYRVSATDPVPVRTRISGLGNNQRVDVYPGGNLQVGNRWVYSGQIEDGPFLELFSVLLDGPQARSSVRLSSNPSLASVLYAEGAVDGRWVTFLDNPMFVGQRLVMAGPADGSLVAQGIHENLAPWQEARPYQIMPDTVSVFYKVYANDVVPMGDTLYLRELPLFADGFETGTSGRWSSTTGAP